MRFIPLLFTPGAPGTEGPPVLFMAGEVLFIPPVLFVPPVVFMPLVLPVPPVVFLPAVLFIPLVVFIPFVVFMPPGEPVFPDVLCSVHTADVKRASQI